MSEHFAVDAGLDGNLRAELLVAPEDSESGVAVVEHELAPGTLAAPLHRHAREDELSVVLAGEMGVEEAGETRTVPAGEAAVKRRGRWHTFWSAGEEPLRFLEVVAPGDFAYYFAESAAILDAGDPEDPETRAALADLHEEYAFEVDPGSVPDLLDRHGLTR